MQNAEHIVSSGTHGGDEGAKQLTEMNEDNCTNQP